jgi:FlaA1/EpsC-like NDP-sugar epimerase
MRAGQNRAANDQVQYGFIGTGSRGTYLLKHLHETDAGRCVAVCDNWDVNLKKGVDTAGNNPAPYKDYRELLARKDIDAVLIAVPLYEHFPITKDSLQAASTSSARRAWCTSRKKCTRCARWWPSIPSRCCKWACSGATASSTRPPSR